MANESSKFIIRVDGDAAAMKMATEKAELILKNLQKAGRKIGRLVVDDIRSHFNTPGQLRIRSGWLANSIFARVARRPSAVRINIGIPRKHPYGAIQTFGKRTKPHLIRPVRKRALRWRGSVSGDPGVMSMGVAERAAFFRSARMGATAEEFAKAVQHPGSLIPPRPFLQPGVLRNREVIQGLFVEALHDALAG